MELIGLEALRKKLANKRERVLTRYAYYDMKHVERDPSPAIPPELKTMYASVLGWCGHAVDSLADMLIFREFVNDEYGCMELFRLNNPDIFFDSAILGALIGSCDFAYLSTDENGLVRMQVIDGSNATGVIDPVTRLLSEGYAVLERDQRGRVLLEAYFLPNQTVYYYADGRTETFSHAVNYPLLVPICYKPDATRPFGHSRINRACMNLQGKACQTLTRSDITAEFYSFPQKYVLGTDPDAERLDTWRATMSTLLEFTKDEDGDKPTIGQFASASMAPHVEQFKMYASAFAGETGLTLDDLGFPQANPASSEAIKASHAKLNQSCIKAQRQFASSFLNVGYVAACLRDDITYTRSLFASYEAKWEPTFGVDLTALGGIGDAVNKLALAFPDYITQDKIRDLTGI